jgi:serine/threonine-protein kinase
MRRYVPTGDVAAGGFGSVEFCQDQNLDRKVALKFIQPGGEHRRLLDELAALQRIRSKHVVQMFDVEYVNPGARMAIVEEFIDGTDLKPLLGRMQADDRFVRLLYQMASGVADIHAVDVVHRDIKPSNMMIDREGILKIIDFNLARPSNEAHTTGFVGTRGYAGPELYVPGEVDFTAKVDVYALGVTAYALLRGNPLPDALRERPPSPDAWRAAGGGFSGLRLPLDAGLVRLLDESLSENPTARPTAGELRMATARLLLRGRHRALLVDGAGTSYEVHGGSPPVTLDHPSSPTLGSVTIGYDGLDFSVVSVTGDAWANNMRLQARSSLPLCCVIALGPRAPNDRRVFITMDLSHPEVVL